jgi:hypothetical protein
MAKVKDVTVEGLDSDNNVVKVIVKQPTVKDYRDAQLSYNKAFREALESGAILRQKLNDYLEKQDIWDEHKQKQYDALIEQIQAQEEVIKSGGIPLKQAKETAIKLRVLRSEFRGLIAEKQTYESNTAEGQADNIRFNFLVSRCVFKEDGITRVWANMDDYDKSGNEQWAVNAASELAQIIYGLDSDYDKNLVENKFLVNYKFARDDLRLVNKDGHLIDADGRLINEESRFVAYKEDGSLYFVDRDGNEVTPEGDKLVDFKPFLDDEGNPVILDSEEPEVTEEEEKPKEKTRTKKASKV